MTFGICQKIKPPAESNRRTKQPSTALMMCAAIGGLLLHANRAAAAASAQAASGFSDFVDRLEWYLWQSVRWVQSSIDTTFYVYNIDGRQLYSIVLTLSILAVFVCLMVKAFTLGKVAAGRVSRDR